MTCLIFFICVHGGRKVVRSYKSQNVLFEGGNLSLKQVMTDKKYVKSHSKSE